MRILALDEHAAAPPHGRSAVRIGCANEDLRILTLCRRGPHDGSGQPPLERSGQTREERDTFVEHRWVTRSELGELPGRLEPAQLSDIAGRLYGM
jgi:hypothetical protein